MSTKTAVIFRVWLTEPTNVIALFPYEPWDASARCVTSFEHVGQHGGADYHGVIRASRAATDAEAAPLKRELERAPYQYDLKVLQRRGRRN